MGGALPSHSPEEGIAYYLMAEYGIWPYSVPLFDLPPEKGRRILKLLETQIPFRLHLLHEIIAALHKINAPPAE